MGRENLFRGLLFCDCCGYHNRRPDERPKTHIIYHEVLHPYVLDQVRAFARSMKRQKVNSPISEYVSIQALTSEILKNVIARIEEGRVGYRFRPGKVIRIRWKLG